MAIASAAEEVVQKVVADGNGIEHAGNAAASFAGGTRDRELGIGDRSAAGIDGDGRHNEVENAYVAVEDRTRASPGQIGGADERLLVGEQRRDNGHAGE